MHHARAAAAENSNIVASGPTSKSHAACVLPATSVLQRLLLAMFQYDVWQNSSEEPGINLWRWSIY
jgi:hypothetical protein